MSRRPPRWPVVVLCLIVSVIACTSSGAIETSPPPATVALPSMWTPTAGLPDSAPATSPAAVPPTTEPTTAPLAGPGLPSQAIAYCSIRNENSDLYMIIPDGTGLTELTSNPSYDCLHQWSPDGDLLAYVSERDRNWDIYVLDPETLTETRITTDRRLDAQYSWSPDGGMLAISSSADDWPEQIWTIRIDGSGLSRVSSPRDVSDILSQGYPTWSPDGSRIACEGMFGAEERSEIHLVQPDGSRFTSLGESPKYTYEQRPAWSPDGRRLAFASNREIYVADLATLERTRLTDNSADDDFPVWSPDGLVILFYRATRVDDAQAPERDLVRIGADGQSELVLTKRFPNLLLHPPDLPSWSADGAWIAFTCTDSSMPDPQRQVCLLSSDGSRLVKVTDGMQDDYLPQFRPK